MTPDEIWEHKVEAEIRSLYFADLTARYTRRKQIITGISFFLSSAAAATVVGKLPSYVPVTLSAIVALSTAYSISVGLDRKAATLAKLHAEWNSLSDDYSRLWAHWYEEDSEDTAYALAKRGRDASLLATTEAPYDKQLMDKWSDHVYSSINGKQPAAGELTKVTA